MTGPARSVARAEDAPVAPLDGTVESLPAEVSPKGAPFHVSRWQDLDGEHWLVVSKVEARCKDCSQVFLYAEHFLKKADKPFRKLSAAKGSMPRCKRTDQGGYATMLWPPGPATNLDQDGRGEVSFSWALGCPSKGMRETATVFLLEGTQIYKVTVPMNSPTNGPPGPRKAAKSVPPRFRAALEESWISSTGRIGTAP